MKKVINGKQVLVLVCLLGFVINKTNNKSHDLGQPISEKIQHMGNHGSDASKHHHAHTAACLDHHAQSGDMHSSSDAIYFRSRGGLVYRTNVIYVNITPSFFFPSSWKEAIYQATEEYNRLNLSIRFEVTHSFFVIGSDANKTVQVEYVDFEDDHELHSMPDAMAVAKFPFNGWPGRDLHINRRMLNNQKKRTMMHELGHIIGIGHTGDHDDNTYPFFTGTTCGEPMADHSIFYRALTPPYRTNFSGCDKEALYYLYGRR